MPKEQYPHKILIVEDEQAMLDALTDNLAAAGFNNLLQAKNGKDGLALALAEKPDLVLLDIVMPKMDGMTMLDKLCKDGPCGNIKVILLTNLSANDSIMKGVIRHEPSYYLVKANYSVEEIVHRVKVVLGIEPLG